MSPLERQVTSPCGTQTPRYSAPQTFIRETGMKRLLLVVLAAFSLAACGEVTQPVQPADRGPAQAPAGPSLNTSGTNVTIGSIYGPGWTPTAIITAPGNYVWQVTSTSYNAFDQLKHKWQVSGDGGMTWHQEHEVTFYNGAWGPKTSQSTRYIPPTANVPFLIRVVATHAGETVVAGPMYVPVNFALTVSVDGPSAITSPGTYTWEAMPTYGNGSYTYQWEVEWHDLGYRSTLGTGKTQTLDLSAADGDFTLHVTAYSGTEQAQDLLPVCNFIPPNGYGSC